MLREPWENKDKQFNEIRKTILEQNEKFNKEIENIRKKQIVALRNTMTAVKNL